MKVLFGFDSEGYSGSSKDILKKLHRCIDPELTANEAEELAQTQGLPAAAFTWYPVTKAVGNVKHDSPEVIQAISLPNP